MTTRHMLNCCWIKKSFVDDFGSTREVVAFCSAHFAIGSNAQGLLFKQLDTLESDGARGSGLLLCH